MEIQRITPIYHRIKVERMFLSSWKINQTTLVSSSKRIMENQTIKKQNTQAAATEAT